MSRSSVVVVVGAGARAVVVGAAACVVGACVVVSVVVVVVIAPGSSAGRLLPPHATAPSVQTIASNAFFMFFVLRCRVAAAGQQHAGHEGALALEPRERAFSRSSRTARFSAARTRDTSARALGQRSPRAAPMS
jgi:hypothetical protein